MFAPLFCNTTDLPEPKPDTVPLTVNVAGVLLDALELAILEALDVLDATLLLALLATELEALEAALLLELLEVTQLTDTLVIFELTIVPEPLVIAQT